MKVTNSTFFTEDEDLYVILANKFENLDKNIKKISTGWTNIVLNVKANNEEYIIKLPRDDFWAEYIIKDADTSNFVRNNLNIKTADMHIEYDNGRPFSIHKKIQGKALTERLNSLNSEKIDNAAKKMAGIFYKLHSFDLSKLPEKFKTKYYNFITKLPKLSQKDYDFSKFDDLLKDENSEEQVFIHGDLNIGNVLLNDNDEIEAIIDYCFSGLGDIYTDLSIFACRINEDFFDRILKEYEKISFKKLDMKKMENRKNLRKYIEQEYIKFMKEIHPEVEV